VDKVFQTLARMKNYRHFFSPYQKQLGSRGVRISERGKKHTNQDGEWGIDFTRQFSIPLAFGELASGYLHPL
jgi:hypothetical protein